MILDMTEKVIYDKGMEKTTLYDVAKKLQVTRPALYKHYRNKEDLFQKLALRWLERTSKKLFAWKLHPGSSRKEQLHEWLWLLATTKKKLYEEDRRMFLLYTDYIEHDNHLVRIHLHELAKKAEEISGWENQGEAIIMAFIYFHNPYFADRWEQANYQRLFEEVWKLITENKKKEA